MFCVAVLKMVSFSKLVLGALAMIAGVAAQSTYPVTVSVPALPYLSYHVS